MIELIAQATQPAAEPLSVIALGAAAIAVLGMVNVFFVLDGDLKSTQPVMSDPVSYALKANASHAEISANKWQGLRAVMVADRLDNYIRRFGLFLRTESGCGLCFLFVGVLVVSFLWAGKDATDRSTQELVLVYNALFVALWNLLIQRCKSMKKTVELLRVT